MEILLFCVYIVITIAAMVFLAKREFHMLQLNGYKIPEHGKWLLKNNSSYLSLELFLAVQLGLLLPKGRYLMTAALMLFDIYIIFAYRYPKKAKKPLVFTFRLKRTMLTLFLLSVVFFMLATVLFIRGTIWEEPRTVAAAYITVGSTLYLMPLLVHAANIIYRPVENCIQRYYRHDAVKKLSGYTRLKKVGITGSYGKTSMKFFLSELLSTEYETLKTPNSYNTPMGVTRTIREQLTSLHRYFVCEMGARRVGEIKELCDIASPHDGIITSVGPQHLETFGSVENVVKTKFELADYVSPNGKIYLNGDNELIRRKAADYPNAVTYGLSEGNDWRAEVSSVSTLGTEFTVMAPDGRRCSYTTKLLGEHNVLNLLGAIAYSAGAGISLEALKMPVLRLSPVPHRLQLREHSKDVTIIDDAYNSNPSGCRAALSVLGLFDAYRIIVTPGMVELGAKQDELNYEFGQEAAEVCDYIALVGKEQTRSIYRGIKESGYDMSKVYTADSLDDAMAHIYSHQTEKRKVVLLENDLPDNY